MEVTKNSSFSAGIFESLVINTLKKNKKGLAKLNLPNGDQIKIGDGDGVHCEININHVDFFKRCVFSGDIGFSEAYIDGMWNTPSITDVIKWFILNVQEGEILSGAKNKNKKVNFLSIYNKAKHWLSDNTKSGSKKNIEYHYDLSNDFYKLWLDETMTYSCGIFDTPETTLHQAQLNKYQSICDSIELKETDHVLEIGSGWGGFACYAAKKYGCKITTITISKEQLKYAKERIKNEDLDHLIDIQYQDYRDMTGQFDKVVSIEMIEAVGHKFLPVYLKKCAHLLKPKGLLTIQVIASPDSRYEEFVTGVDFIQKHIFPGSLLPSLGEMSRILSNSTELHMIKMKDFGDHYAHTLKLWFKSFNKHIEEVKALGFDEKFIRMWNYYLNYCEAAFNMRNISVSQVTYTRPNNTDIDTIF